MQCQKVHIIFVALHLILGHYHHDHLIQVLLVAKFAPGSSTIFFLFRLHQGLVRTAAGAGLGATRLGMLFIALRKIIRHPFR